MSKPFKLKLKQFIKELKCPHNEVEYRSRFLCNRDWLLAECKECGKSWVELMREIKFRAWEKNLKEIIPVDDINFNRKMINISTAWRMFDEVELMQYTGIKDKNGVEIYEGDILTCDHYPFKDDGKPNYNAEVYWDKDYCLQFCIRLYCVNDSKRGISSGMCEALIDRFDSSEECEFEVIGNIYENEDLLKRQL